MLCLFSLRWLTIGPLQSLETHKNISADSAPKRVNNSRRNYPVIFTFLFQLSKGFWMKKGRNTGEKTQEMEVFSINPPSQQIPKFLGLNRSFAFWFSTCKTTQKKPLMQHKKGKYLGSTDPNRTDPYWTGLFMDEAPSASMVKLIFSSDLAEKLGRYQSNKSPTRLLFLCLHRCQHISGWRHWSVTELTASKGRIWSSFLVLHFFTTDLTVWGTCLVEFAITWSNSGLVLKRFVTHKRPRLLCFVLIHK